MNKINSDRKYANILNVGVNGTSRQRVLRDIWNKLINFDKIKTRQAPFLIVTPNPEIVLRAQDDPKLASILNKAEFSLADGIGLSQAFCFNQLPKPKNKFIRLPVLLIEGFVVGLATFLNKKWLFDGLNIIKGRELFMDLIKLANKKGWRVTLIGDKDGSSFGAKEALERSFKKIKLFSFDAPDLDNSGFPIIKSEEKQILEIVKEISQIRPQMVFVGFGAPRQEKWLFNNLPKLNAGMGMVVGASFHWVSGKSAVAPSWVAKIGLEWLWRLFTGSSDVKRIVNAVIVFPWKVFVAKLEARD